ncbi:MAG: hypothetical protein ABIT69_10045 [Sphingomicrobium sp.]
MDDKIYDEPSDVGAEDGHVTVTGPDSVDVKLSPEAAAETSDRLLQQSMKARGQQMSEEKRGHRG